MAYAGGWKKMEPLWDWTIRSKRVANLRPALEAVLTGFGRHMPRGKEDDGAARSEGTDRAHAPGKVLVIPVHPAQVGEVDVNRHVRGLL